MAQDEIFDSLIEHLHFVMDQHYTYLLRLNEDKHLVSRQHYVLHVPRQMDEKESLYQLMTF